MAEQEKRHEEYEELVLELEAANEKVNNEEKVEEIIGKIAQN